jgi:ornithine cyclodeaminase/alanine dehydrogenase
MRAGRTQLPPKPSIYPRDDCFLHAMPAYVADLDAAVVKWIGGSSGNKSRGLPYLAGLIIVSDPATGSPRAILDAADITAARTAAVTAICVSRFAGDSLNKIAIVGLGVQGRTHARVLRELHSDAEIAVTGEMASDDDGRWTVSDLDGALRGADVVITTVRMDRSAQPFIHAETVRDARLIVPVDFDAAIAPDAVKRADFFITDHAETFEYYRALGHFSDWPQPTHALADALATGLDAGRVVACNLGVATLDAVFAHAVLDNAIANGVGTLLP